MDIITVEPEGNEPLATMVFLHGLGANGHDFEPVARQLQPILPLRWVLPSADPMPVSINGGIAMPAWYDVTDLSRADGVEWWTVDITRGIVRDLLSAEHAGFPQLPVILGGFSQGGAISLHCGFDSSVSLKGIVALSSYLLVKDGQNGLPEDFDPASAPPVFMGHGSWDDVVPPELSMAGRDAMRSAGINVDWHEYPMPHSVCPQELQDLVFWLFDLLGASPEQP